jgi:hypothetical protein
MAAACLYIIIEMNVNRDELGFEPAGTGVGTVVSFCFVFASGSAAPPFLFRRSSHFSNLAPSDPHIFGEHVPDALFLFFVALTLVLALPCIHLLGQLFFFHLMLSMLAAISIAARVFGPVSLSTPPPFIP